MFTNFPYTINKFFFIFFFNDTATTEIYTLSLHDALPITFVTPTIVHFGAALALAAYLSMPHQSVPTLSAGVGVVGLGGLSYGGLVAARLRRQGSRYVPVREDWIWNAILPTSAYGALTASAVLMWHRPLECLYVVGAMSLLLLFIGIRNAWDIAVWMTLHKEPDTK